MKGCFSTFQRCKTSTNLPFHRFELFFPIQKKEPKIKWWRLREKEHKERYVERKKWGMKKGNARKSEYKAAKQRAKQEQVWTGYKGRRDGVEAC